MRYISQLLVLASIALEDAVSASTTNPTPAPTPDPTSTPTPTPTPTTNLFPQCEPDFTCPDGDNPVCGSDGFTYASECALLVSACTAPWIFVASEGECQTSAPLPRPTPACGPGVTCPPDEEPVCGSDGVTYTNVCVFSVAMCKDPSLDIVGNGVCNYMIAPTPKPMCADGYLCEPVRDPVCGSDGKTYNNKCELTVAQCKSDSLVIAGGGPCTSNTFDCSASCDATQDFVCGSDGKTYDNECFLEYAKYCSPGDASLVVASQGDCISNGDGELPVDEVTTNGWAATTETPRPPRTPSSTLAPKAASCDGIACTRERKPVCGSDGKTYGNECQLKRAQCLNSKLTLVSTDACSPTASTSTVGKDADDESSASLGLSSSPSFPSSSTGSSSTGSSSTSSVQTSSTPDTNSTSTSTLTGSSSYSVTGVASPSLTGTSSTPSASSSSPQSSSMSSSASGVHYRAVELFLMLIGSVLVS